MQPLISLCMIVRNEAHCLGQCLASVRDSVDEIIVVDTGSDDASPDIARAFNARVVRHAWDDDFSTPRNVSLEHANGRWVLMLDADETLTDKDRPRVKALLRDNDVQGYRLLIRLHPEWTEVYSIRLFRNSPSLRFKGIYHEVLTITESDRRNFVDSDIRILHTPWSPEICKTKYERNVRLLRKHIATYPQDLYQILDLTRLYLESDRLIDTQIMLD